jgi:hypothetical protein
VGKATSRGRRFTEERARGWFESVTVCQASVVHFESQREVVAAVAVNSRHPLAKEVSVRLAANANRVELFTVPFHSGGSAFVQHDPAAEKGFVLG